MERQNVSGRVEPSRRQERDERGLTREDTGARTLRPLREYGLHPFEMLRRTTREMDRMFENWGFGGFAGTHWPAIEMFDQNNHLVIRVEMPGMRREDVRVRVVGDTLVIEGERHAEDEEKREALHRSEWNYGRFSREILIPYDLDSTQLTARMQNGVLELTMPYRAERRAREIEIRGEEPVGSRTRH